jgi:TolB-like protein/Tfp pilus assembly protein PilF
MQQSRGPRRFLGELRRRKVLGTIGWYLGGAFVIMQVVEAVQPYTGLPDVAGSIVLGILVAGFPVAIVLSWAFDITPQSFRRERPLDSLPGDGGRGVPSTSKPKALRADSVAVLPFDNLSDDPENAYFSDGITDDIIAAVAHVQGLRILCRSSVMKYKGLDGPIGVIAGELGVATIVMGSVRRSGSRVRIVAEVIDAHSEAHLWTDTYDRELEDIFQVQSEVASEIAKAVQRELSSHDRQRIERRGTNDPESYDLYLRARYLWSQRTEVSVLESIRYFERALERDADFALAHSGLADAFTVLGIYGLRDPREVLETAKKEVACALAIEPTLAEAITSRACIDAIYGWRWSDAEDGFRRAVELEPSYATAYQWYAINLLAPRARFDEARAQLDQASLLDPGSSTIAISRGIVSFYARDSERATQELEELAQLHPRFALIFLFLGQSYEVAGRMDDAVETLRRAVELSEESSESLAALGHALALAGETSEAQTLLTRLQERSDRAYVSPAQLAQVLIGLGRHDDALDELDRAVAGRATDLVWAGVRPVYDPLRGTARFDAILSEVGLA